MLLVYSSKYKNGLTLDIISKVSILNYRFSVYMISTVFCPPSIGILVICVPIIILNESFDVHIKYRSRKYRLLILFCLSASYRTRFRYQYQTLLKVLIRALTTTAVYQTQDNKDETKGKTQEATERKRDVSYIICKKNIYIYQ